MFPGVIMDECTLLRTQRVISVSHCTEECFESKIKKFLESVQFCQVIMGESTFWTNIIGECFSYLLDKITRGLYDQFQFIGCATQEISYNLILLPLSHQVFLNQNLKCYYVSWHPLH